MPTRVTNHVLTPAPKIWTAQLNQFFEDAWNAHDGAPGGPTGDGKIHSLPKGRYRQYENGRIYIPHNRPGYHVYGAIGEKYLELGGPNGRLGWPTSSEQPFADEGRATTFENGAIYWWPDTGPIELGNVAVRYSGFFCHGVTGGLGGDEPYIIFGVVPAIGEASEVKTRIYGEDDDRYGSVDAGDSRYDDIVLYQGLPYGTSVMTTLMEHDLGDPNTYLAQTQEAVDEGGRLVATTTGGIPIVGPVVAVALHAIWGEVAGAIAGAINNLFGTADDFVGAQTVGISAKQMVTLARAPLQESKGVKFNLLSPLITGDGATYQVAFRIEAV